jgi:hypothetical protein
MLLAKAVRFYCGASRLCSLAVDSNIVAPQSPNPVV